MWTFEGGALARPPAFARPDGRALLYKDRVWALLYKDRVWALLYKDRVWALLYKDRVWALP
jgi:hypothetical protein